MAVLTPRNVSPAQRRPTRASIIAKAATKSIQPCPRRKTTTLPSGFSKTLMRPAPPPELDDASYMFCLDRLAADIGPRALYALSQTSISAPSMSGTLPETIPACVSGPLPPSHAVAVYSPSTNNMSLFPVHEDILAAHCTKLSSLACPEHVPENHLPVQSLCIPHSASYGPLSQYLYTHRQDVLFNALCTGVQMFTRQPYLSDSESTELDEEDVERVAKMIRASRTRAAVLQSMHFIRGLHGNLLALGIHEDGVWEAVQLAWRLHHAAWLL